MKKNLFTPLNVVLGFHVVIVLLAMGYFIAQKGAPKKSPDKIVVLPVRGPIQHSDAEFAGTLSVDSMVKYINNLAENDSVKALVLRINSPGGSVGAVQDLYRALDNFKKEGKFVVSSFGDVAASGGYYIACAGDYIVANPGTLTGSIGVLMQLPQAGGLLKKIGLDFEIIKSGQMKDAGSPFKKLSAKEREYFQSVIEDSYGQFLKAVEMGRPLTEKELRPRADGRIFTGSMALEAKLVDELGGLERAIEKAKELSGLADKEPQIIYKKEAPPLIQLLELIGKSPLAKIQKSVASGPQLLYLFQ